MKRSGSTRLKARSSIFLLCLLLACALITVKLFDYQVLSAASLQTEAKAKRAVPLTIPSLRGDIVDRNGVVLATTEERYDVQLSPKNAKLDGGTFLRRDPAAEQGVVAVTAQQAYREIAQVTGQEAAEIAQIVDDAIAKDKTSDFAYVKRGINLMQLRELKELGIPWVTFDVHHKRIYPSGAVAGTIVGFAGQDEVPLSGVELSQDKCLAGEDGSEEYERGADGVQLPGSAVQTKAATNGGTVHLTIDRDLQWQAQQVINATAAKVQAEYAYLVIMDARTGELLAVAEDGSVDPNNISATEESRLNARAFTSPYEPGSTYKIITAATAIETGKATAQTSVVAPDNWQPEAHVSFRDWFAHPPLKWSLTGALVYSSNVGISMLGSRVPQETRYEYLQKFGVGEPTKAGMPLEDGGLLYDQKDWDRQTSYVTMFGQGLSSTIVQTASVYQTIANDGLRVPPAIVASCTDAAGKVHKLKHGEPVQVVSASTAKQSRDMLETLADEGLVTNILQIPGYRMGGKTGTAQQTNGQGGYRSDYVYSFAGMFPMDDPQFVLVATVGFPHGGDGTQAAVSAFHDAAAATIRHFHLPPSSGDFKPLDVGDKP